MNELQLIQNKIYEIRGQRVMLDFDLAVMYQVETKVLKQAVRRNSQRFPSDFMFELTQEEYNDLIISLRSQIVTLETGRGKYPKYAPFAFTEQGVAMLSSVLRSETAIQVNIAVMRAFVAIRQLLIAPPSDRIGRLETQVQELKEYIEEIFADQNDINEDTRMQLELINQTLAELQSHDRPSIRNRRPIGFIRK